MYPLESQIKNPAIRGAIRTIAEFCHEQHSDIK